MFLSGIISAAAKTLSSFFGGSSAGKAMSISPAKQASAPAAMKKIPALSVAPIANWGESAASLQARTAAWKASSAKATQDQYFVDLQKWQMEEDARKRRVAMEGKLSTAVDKKTQELRIGSVAPQSLTLGAVKEQNLVLGKNPHEGFATQAEKDSFDKWFSQQSPEKQAQVTEYNKVKNEYRAKALQTVEQYRSGNKQNNFWSWFTGGWSTDEDTRKFAQSQIESLSNDNVVRYEKKLADFLKWQAENKQILEKSKVSSEEEYQQALSVFNKQDELISDLNYSKAAMEGMAEAYGTKASEKSGTALGQLFSWFGDVGNALNANPIFKYTLGSGDENTPSVVTAPGRFVNWIGNLIDSKGQKNYRDGTSTAGLPANKNAWQATYDQRNWNVENRKKFSEDDFQKWYKQQNTSQWSDYFKAGKGDKVEKYYREMYRGSLDTSGNVNDFIDFFGDPIGLIPGGKIATSFKGLSTAVKTTKLGAWLDKGITKLSESKAVSWLGKEYKTPEVMRSDAIRAAQEVIRNKQQSLLPKLKAYTDALHVGGKALDTTILDDLSKLTDSEVQMFQRVVDGKAAARDRIANWTPTAKFKHPTIVKIEDLARRWTDFTEQMKIADNVTHTRFGRGKAIYVPNTSWIPREGEDFLSMYDFKKFQKSKNKNALDFQTSIVDRYFVSEIDNAHAASEGVRLTRAERGRQRLLDEYQSTVGSERAKILELDRKNGGVKRWFNAQHKGVNPSLRPSFGRSLYNTARRTASLPLRAWKHAALARPGWTVNNVLYNVPASVLSSGPGALLETAKMISPTYRRKAFDESRRVFGSQLGRELPVVGKTPVGRTLSRWYKFNTTLEDVSRVAAGRAALRKGMSEEQALTRVNNYLFDYTTKNWERPLKTALPFWSWNKNVTKAALRMPFDRPYAAVAYNRFDTSQRQQFESDWQQVADGLRQNGYSESEIETMKAGYAKKYAGKVKFGGKYYNTPFNAFSEDGVGNFGINPYLTAAAESASSTDRWGRKLYGSEADFSTRVANEFPQISLGKKAYDAWGVAVGKNKPTKRWIGAPGNEGYGLTKERQGYDSSRPNYDPYMDPRVGLGDSALAFLGKPTGVTFDTAGIVENKKLQKMTDEYFALNTEKMSFPDAEKARQAVFDKYGITADEFYKGILAKYDSDQTKQIKSQKEEAAALNKSLFDEYSRQPEGTRSVWAVGKLRQLVSEGYFAKNPFVKSFDWMTPATVAKADKKVAYDTAVRTGDWSSWRQKYGDSRKISAKKIAYDRAVATGDWDSYHAKYGYKTKTKYQYDGKYFHSQESMDKYRSGEFWKKYFAADSVARKQLLQDNPEFNTRANWTTAQWNAQKAKDKKERIARARAWGGLSGIMDAKTFAAQAKSTEYLTKRTAGRSKRLTWA